MKVRFVVYRDGLGSVFDSLYLTPARLLRRCSIESSIVSFAPIGQYFRSSQARQWKGRYRTLERILPGGVARWPVGPSRLSTIDPLFIASYMYNSGSLDKEMIFHCGGAAAAYFALKARKRLGSSYPKIILHSLGPVAEEYTYGIAGREDAPLDGKHAAEREQRRRMEEYAYRNADIVICISSQMRAAALAHFGVDEKRTFLIPCLVDAALFEAGAAERETTRKREGIDDRFIVVFSGTLHPWQKPEVLFELFRIVKKHVASAYFLLLTPSVTTANALAHAFRLGPSDFRTLTVPFDEVPRYLAAADLGLLARGFFEESNRVNSFSSPIKVPEYLVAGCPVIMASGIGDLSEIVRANEFGVVAYEGDDLDTVEGKIGRFIEGYFTRAEMVRTHCSTMASRLFDIRQNLQSYLSVYASLN